MPSAPPTSNGPLAAVTGTPITWRPTKIMNMRDLSKDDDFLSHLLVEKLGTGTVPLLVHKMDPSRRLPKTNVEDLLQIVRRLVSAKGPTQNSFRQAVDELLVLPPVRYYLKPYTQKQINAFATHASRYFELYQPQGFIEIAHTSRYSHRTGKSELCILATRTLAPGMVITELKGSMAHLTKEEDKELKRTDLRNSDIRRDFSVIHSRQMKKNHLFLGPARFVNHDCENNCELFREGKYITFRVIKPIGIGEEITAHYGDGYFGYKNRHCLCETCEKKGRGGYAPDHSDGGVESGCESTAAASEGGLSEIEGDAKDKGKLNINERRTRRGVYAIVQEEEEDDSEESEDEDKESHKPLAHIAEDDLELDDEASSLSKRPACSRESSHPFSSVSVSQRPGFSTPDPDIHRPQLSNTPSTSSHLNGYNSNSESRKAPFRSIISTRRQKLSEEPDMSGSNKGLEQPSPTVSSRTSRDKTERLSTPSVDKCKGNPSSTEEPETRVLRARPASHAILAELPKPPEVLRGEDGIPLPTCVTCMNVLPVISVDSQVVWGLGFDIAPRRGRKRKEKQECPRCMRHFAIYDLGWPARIPAQNTASNPTPREESISVDMAGRMTHKTLSTLDRKLASAALAAKKHKRQAAVDERSSKKCNADHTPRVEMSAKAKELLIATRPRGRPRKTPIASQESTVDPPKRKRGRPRLSSPRGTLPEKALKPKSLAVQCQPRDSNGRFGKKASTNGKFVRKKYSTLRSAASRAQRAVERTKVKLWLESKNEEALGSANAQPDGSAFDLSSMRKRAEDPFFDEPEPPAKRLRSGVVINESNQSEPYRPPRYDGVSSFRFRGMGSSLLSRPNPLNYARRTWAPPHSDEMIICTDEDESVSPPHAFEDPATPEDHTALPIIVETAASPRLNQLHIRSNDNDDGDDGPTTRARSLISAKPLVGALTFKPSPINFARRRWSIAPRSPNDAESVHRKGSLESNGFPIDFDASGMRNEILEGRSREERTMRTSSITTSVPAPAWLSASRSDGMPLDKQDYADASKFALQHQASFEAPQTTQTLEALKRSSGCFISGSDDTPSSEDDEKLSSMNSQIHVVYDREIPNVAPWDKAAFPAALSHYLQKSVSFRTDDSSSPPNFVNAGWDSSSDISTD